MTRKNAHPKPKMIPKPWGHEILWAQTKTYMGKFLVIKKGHRLSLQYHKKKHETIYTLRGKWRLVLGRKKSIQSPGSVTVIPPRTVHRFEASYGRVTLIEVSTPGLLDIVRLQDDYKRRTN